MNQTPTKVFLVDDHKILRESLIMLLNHQSGIEVVGEADDGHKALHAISGLKPDVVILDISIPGLNGLEVASRLKHDFPNIKIIMLTMHKNEEMIAKAFANGASGYVLKENAFEELLKAIDTVLENRIFMSDNISDTVVSGFVANYHSRLKSGNEIISPREREVLQLLAEGFSNKEIASKLTLSLKTVETHRSNIMRKLEFKGITDLVIYAVRNHIIEV
jgi:DNA-binding NarL/FixJ family response regulator